MTRIRILGSSAGGGLPQWNCACANCLAARRGEIAAQTQSSIAITADDDSWWLINASPDLAGQVEANAELRPQRRAVRNSPITGVLLTNADLDHVIGLLLMRQQSLPIIVYATAQTRNALRWLEELMQRFSGIEWREPPREFQSLNNGIRFRAIELSQSVAFHLRDEITGATALIAPAVGKLTSELRDAVRTSDVLFFDGTFWSNEELRAVRPDARTAREMNHLPIKDGSLDFLAQCSGRRRIYTHINNTNPVLMAGSAERLQVEQAGIEIGHDGFEVTL